MPVHDKLGLLRRLFQERRELNRAAAVRLLGCAPNTATRYLRILEQEGLIEPSPDGAMTTEKIQDFLDHLKEILETMSNTVNELRESIE